MQLNAQTDLTLRRVAQGAAKLGVLPLQTAQAQQRLMHSRLCKAGGKRFDLPYRTPGPRGASTAKSRGIHQAVVERLQGVFIDRDKANTINKQLLAAPDAAQCDTEHADIQVCIGSQGTNQITTLEGKCPPQPLEVVLDRASFPAMKIDALREILVARRCRLPPSDRGSMSGDDVAQIAFVVRMHREKINQVPECLHLKSLSTCCREAIPHGFEHRDQNRLINRIPFGADITPRFFQGLDIDCISLAPCELTLVRVKIDSDIVKQPFDLLLAQAHIEGVNVKTIPLCAKQRLSPSCGRRGLLPHWRFTKAARGQRPMFTNPTVKP